MYNYLITQCSFSLAYSSLTVFYIVSIRRCGGLQIRRLLVAGCFSCGILGCDSISGILIPASVFDCIQGFDASLATASHAGHGAGVASSLVS